MADSKSSSSFSFGFSKQVKPARVISATAKSFNSAQEETSEVDYVKNVSDKGIEGSIVKEEKKELVIPCMGNQMELLNKLHKSKIKSEVKKESVSPTVNEEAPDDLKAQAAAEILKDSETWKEDRENETEEKTTVDEIPLSADVALRAEQSTLDDYENVPVEGFGMGMLRGMGFKAGEGIGGFKKADIKCLDPVIRPKGLGLGASRPNANSKQGSAAPKGDNDEVLVLKRDAHVYIVSGSQKDRYGIVDGMDEDAARVFVKMAVGGKVVSVSENAIKLVPKSEYKKYSKVINKDSYNEYEAKQKQKQKEWDDGRNERDNRTFGKSDRSERKRSRSRSPFSNQKKSKSSNGSSSKSSSSSTSAWLMPQLRVRLIDNKYKKGKYYNEKMVIEDVFTPTTCCCRTADGRILDDIMVEQLETIVPKNSGSHVKVVRGRNKGKVGELIERNKKNYIAVVQILPDRDEVLKLDFDDICEYLGPVTDFDY